ncbi:MAG: alpha-L-arabinofuranosidase C-terminal domain-containing protein [Chthoniobacteraceae bacterium]
MAIGCAVLCATLAHAAPLPQATLTVNLAGKGKAISPDLFGIFFEDLNYAADGGLYGELIQNRSFEYDATEQPTWNALTAWQLVKRGGGDGGWKVENALPINANNPHYITLMVKKPGAGVGVSNAGVGGIPVKAGESYDASFFARQLYMRSAWGPDNSPDGRPMPVSIRLEAKDGTVLAEAPVQVNGRDWKKVTATLTPSRTEDAATFVLLGTAEGGIALDEISLFPHHTFHDRPNGLRADLAQTIADIHPKFVRFPGGCLAHGDGIGNIYRWKDTIGPVEQRKQQKNLWGYHQSVGLGYFEYFQFCEDIGAKPLPVLLAGVSCQNSNSSPGLGQECMPLADLPAYIQDLKDLIEYANGPATSKWGAKRAAAGHPEPFHLQYLGIGNEDKITPGFEERFTKIYKAVHAEHPEIQIVGTAGPFPEGEDFDKGWKVANQLHVAIIDEHYYQTPEWFLSHFNRYDGYDRNHSKVYVGEYAASEKDRRNTLQTAIAEAAYMTQLERNGDVVHMASYAPLLSFVHHSQWHPDMIYFDGTHIDRSINYYVQQLFASNSGETYFASTLNDSTGLATSVVREQKSGDLILKIVNYGTTARPLRINLDGAQNLGSQAVQTVLAGDPNAENTFETTQPLTPVTGNLPVQPAFDCEAPASSLTVIRIPQA